jgi:hypothetical protein
MPINSKQGKSDKITYIILFFIAFAAAFTSSYNPINFRRMHVDSSVYITIAQGITRGYLPYRDFVDNKGPLTYLISAPGLYLGGFTGIWITEIILMCISVFFAYKTALLFDRGNRYITLLGTAFSFVVLLAFFSVNAGTEEYSLPFLMISLYIFAKYFFSPKQEIRFGELVILGFSFTCAVLIRLNVFPLWAGFCVVVFVEAIFKRRFRQLGKYILGFCLGIAVVFVPVFLYLKLNGIADVFFDQVIYGGAAKGFSESNLKEIAKNFYIVISRNFSAIPLFSGLFWIITKYKHPHFNFYSGYTVSYFLMLLFFSFSSSDSHNNMALVPFFIPALVFLIDLVYSAFYGIKAKNVILVLFFCIVFSEGLAKYIYNLSKIFFDNTGNQLINTGKMIDKNTKAGDKIISLGFNGYIYPFTQRDAASKYIYQGSGLNQIPGSREEFISDILNNKPAIIAIFIGDDGRSQYMNDWHNPVFEMIDKKYRILSNENGFILYIRND